MFDYGEVEFACQRFSPKDLFVTISLSGEGAETLRVVRCAQAGNIQTLSVTRWENNALARMCQESLYVGTRRVQQSVGQSYELVSPILPNAYSVADPNSGVNAVMAFGGIPIVGCQGSVLTAILTALIGATLEKKLRKVMPNALDLIMTPFVEFLVTIPFGIGGFIIGATYLLLVITGLHHTYTMIETSLLANTGFNPVITLCAIYGFANVGTCLAFFVKSKKESIRQTSIGAMLSQLFGISEPVLFGIQLRFNLRQLLWYFMISIFSVAMCFGLTTLFAIPKEVLEEEDSEPVQQGGITRTAGENNEAGRDN